MPSQFEIRLPSEEVAARYRAQGLWSDRTLAQEFEAGLRRWPDLRYKVWSDTRPFDGDFRQIEDRAKRLATYLHGLGVGPGDVVSFQLPNCVEATETFLATLFIGAISLPIVHTYGAREIQFTLAQSRVKAHVTAERFRAIDYRTMMETLAPQLPDLEHIVTIDDYDALIAGPPIAQIHVAHPDDVAVINYTSGTTSDPKGVIKTHRVCLAEMVQRVQRDPGDTRPIPLDPPETHRHWLTAAPLGHGGGLQTGVEMPFLLGRPVQLIDHWDLDKVMDILAEGDVALGACANFFFNSIINHPRFGPAHLERMRYMASGGAPVPRAFGELCEGMGITLVRGYGLTEHHSVSGSAYADPLDKRIGTDGRALTGNEIEIRDDTGRRLPPGEAGLIFTRGPELFVGYVDASLNAYCFDENGWFCTGDVGALDEDGYLTITDRVKDIIIRGGENVSASEVEQALAQMPEMLEVAVIAAPDERMGERVCAIVRLKEGASAPDLAEVRRRLADFGLMRQKWPEELRVVADFERTPSGKIKKHVLRDQLRAEAAAPARAAR